MGTPCKCPLHTAPIGNELPMIVSVCTEPLNKSFCAILTSYDNGVEKLYVPDSGRSMSMEEAAVAVGATALCATTRAGHCIFPATINKAVGTKSLDGAELEQAVNSLSSFFDSSGPCQGGQLTTLCPVTPAQVPNHIPPCYRARGGEQVPYEESELYPTWNNDPDSRKEITHALQTCNDCGWTPESLTEAILKGARPRMVAAIRCTQPGINSAYCTVLLPNGSIRTNVELSTNFVKSEYPEFAHVFVR